MSEPKGGGGPVLQNVTSIMKWERKKEFVSLSRTIFVVLLNKKSGEPITRSDGTKKNWPWGIGREGGHRLIRGDRGKKGVGSSSNTNNP